RAQPAVALKVAGDAAGPPSRATAVVALGLLTAGGLAAVLPAVGGVPVFGYVAIALLLAGGGAARPWLARLLLTPLQRNTAPAPRRVRGAPRGRRPRLWGAWGPAPPGRARWRRRRPASGGRWTRGCRRPRRRTPLCAWIRPGAASARRCRSGWPLRPASARSA